VAGSPTQIAMYRGVDLWKILVWTGLLLAASLYRVDPLEPFFSSAALIFPLAAEYVELSLFVDNAVSGTTAHHGASATNDRDATRLFASDGIAVVPRNGSLVGLSTMAYQQLARPIFGMETEPAVGEISSKWRAVQAEIEQEKAALTLFRTEQACPAAARALLDVVAESADRARRARIGLINRAVNLALIPTSDEARWGLTDRWSPPFETLQTDRGDCEDYVCDCQVYCAARGRTVPRRSEDSYLAQFCAKRRPSCARGPRGWRVADPGRQQTRARA
jgi:predicted transglutaminase-like cysteine proteinase